MKILYGIQATGNGHVARAKAIIPELRRHVEVDLLVSGAQAELELPMEPKYRLKGLGFYFGKNGGINLWKTLTKNNLLRFFKEIHQLRLDEYDIVITDFEPVTAWAAIIQGKYLVGIGNQYALRSPWVALPKSYDLIGKAIIRWYAPARITYPIHYTSLHPGIFKPIIREEIRNIEPEQGNHYLVYLPSFSDQRIIQFLRQFPTENWVVFSKNSKENASYGHIKVQPISEAHFLKELASCKGVLCNAGFGVSSEAIYLQKKLIVLPMRMQYEQQCNAFSLQQIGVPVLKGLGKKDHELIREWLSSAHYINLYYPNQTKELVHTLLENYIRYSGSMLDLVQEKLLKSA